MSFSEGLVNGESSKGAVTINSNKELLTIKERVGSKAVPKGFTSLKTQDEGGRIEQSKSLNPL